MPGVTHIYQLQAIAVLWAWSFLSRAVVNNVIFAAGILLQTALAFFTFQRGIARRFPGFAALITFYPLRAGLFFALSGHIDADAFDPLVNALSLAEMLLQAWVAVEIVRRLIGEVSGWARRRGLILFLLLGVAFGCTWAVPYALPGRTLVDRVQLLAWFVMLALFAAAFKVASSRNLRCIVYGFAGFAAIQLAALAGKASAVRKHHAGVYIGWSYVPALGYLAVVVFWLMGFKREAAA
jgi:hypothetical protein